MCTKEEVFDNCIDNRVCFHIGNRKATSASVAMRKMLMKVNNRWDFSLVRFS